jgi:ligand-binding SRPBCC domain-containing protein
MVYRINRDQTVPASLDAVWDYFSKPENLNELTPPDLNFEIVYKDSNTMFQGQLIEYMVQFIPLFRSRWLTEINHVEDLAYFVDEQRIGPYRFWYHEHLFRPVENGTQIIDQVTYQLPFGPIGELAHLIWIKPRLEKIFDYREHQITAIFS